MKSDLAVSLRLTFALSVLLCALYPFAVWAVGRTAFGFAAGGSFLERDGAVVGSALIGQPFAGDRYFHPRPSAAGAGYDGAASSGSNLGPTSQALRERMAADIARLGGGRVPADAVTASASGLDPHISPAYARMQIARVARSRGMSESDVFAAVRSRIEPRFLGVFGEPRVNVLELNLQLDAMMKGHASRR